LHRSSDSAAGRPWCKPLAEYLAAVEVEAAPTHSAMATDKGEDKDDGPETPRKRRGERKAPKVISPSDPASAWTAKANKRVQFGYGLNYLIDVENAVIIDVEATPARTYDEVAATKTMIDRTKECFDLKPKRSSPTRPMARASSLVGS
jgi:hypothetical protein